MWCSLPMCEKRGSRGDGSAERWGESALRAGGGKETSRLTATAHMISLSSDDLY